MTALDPRLNAIRPDLADARLRGQIEARHFADGRVATVRTPFADLRRRAGSDQPLETQALFGEAVRVFEEDEEGWSWVQLERDRYVGWMPSASLVDGASPEPTHRVRVSRTLVFPGPDIKQPPMHDLPLGAMVRVKGEAEDRNARYALIEPFGAVVLQHLEPADAVAPDVVAVGELFMGVPYLWGGKSALGIDCSGLVQLALAQAGIEAPRDTDLQFRDLGTALPEGARLQRGDLAFWPGHVGMMLDGERLLHANAHHMMTAVEPLAEAISRTGAKGTAFLGLKRL
ncbi:C40 family peptidase [Aureimonas jatrophae]|uniref:NlpC/P60 family protein n=1 Tax=Aureimonas jatrophae TaxID=1166073 RepID=A0A1H0LUL5_9HYPH|nr:C40 family peptidase [Aureimonas jatrophae]MBB3952755.1 hypothetical protein [Aureimonas jatrophae]SDO71864.1 NlpC/P60 family protein [Aureimonas jatrophae]